MSVSRKCLLLCIFCLITIPVFSQGTYLELNLNEPSMRGSFNISQQKSPLDIFRVIEKAAEDKKINGIILNIGNFSANREYYWELRNSLEYFKSGGKKVCAFISNADIDLYCLASAADKIVMDELGTLTIMGYVMGRGYAKHALEKLGIGVRELRYLEYKSAAETFTRDSMSDADRRQYSEYLDDIFNETRSTLLNARSFTGEEFDTILNGEFLYSAKSAKNRKLIDYIGRKDAVIKAINELEEKEVKSFYLFGDSMSSITGSKTNYVLTEAGGLFSKPPVIAIVYANGQTDMESGMGAWNLAKIVRELADNKRVKAIVLRINSPGGSAEAADYLDAAVRYAKQKMPVVVSMGEVAASGGYWAAMNATHIAASPYTITGSIGVIGTWFYDNGLNAKLGLNTDIIQRGAHADLLTGILVPYRNLSPQEEGRYREYILDLYGMFVEKVAAGRFMEVEKAESVAQGRIFSGVKAQEAGLIDSIGGLSDAIRIARSLANVSEVDVIYREYPKLSFMEKLLSRSPLAGLFLGKNNSDAIGFFSELVFPFKREDIRYRLEKNGQILTILPLEFSVF